MSIAIVHVMEIQKATPLGVPANEVRVEFKVGTHGPFFINITKEDFLKGLAMQKVTEYANHIIGLVSP